MEFEKEVRRLLNTDYQSLDEKEIITGFCNSLKDLNHITLDTNYWNYYSYRRQAQISRIHYNQDSFDTVEEIYRKLKSEEKP